MSTFRIADAESAAGRRLRRRIAARLDSLLDRKVEREARRIVEGVRRRGEEALLAAVRRHDGSAPEQVAALRLAPLAEDAGWPDLDPKLRAAIELAIDNVARFHRAQLRPGSVLAADGALIEELVRPLDRVGIYVPGGRASYPSTAIMTVVPARVAGVGEIAVATPARTYWQQPALRYTLARLGIDEVWGIGGAQAVAALAFGCGPLRRVDAIAGPGNAWVAAAKRLVAGRVAIDGLMGPSEIAIVAGEDADCERVAADLLAQAEHDPQASALLITASARLARAVASAIERQLEGLATAPTARAALVAFGGALCVRDLDAAAKLARELAPEHLHLVGAEVEAAADRFEVAGAIFVGDATPEVFGDYVAGPSHVLPTCGTARFASGLSVETFRRRTHRLRRFGDRHTAGWADAAAVMALAEGLPAHAAAARLRVADRCGERAS